MQTIHAFRFCMWAELFWSAWANYRLNRRIADQVMALIRNLWNRQFVGQTVPVLVSIRRMSYIEMSSVPGVAIRKTLGVLAKS